MPEPTALPPVESTEAIPESLPERPTRGEPTPQQREFFFLTLTVLAVVLLLAVAALVFFGFISFLSWSYPILLPLGLAVLVALTLSPVVEFLVRRRLNRAVATLIACALFVILFILFWFYFGATVYVQAGDVVGKVRDALSGHSGTADWLNTTLPEWLKTNVPNWQQELPKNLSQILYNGLAPVGQAFGILLGFAFVPIYVYYFLAEKDELAARWKDFVPLRRSPLRDEVIAVLHDIQVSLVSYLRGQIVVAGANGLLTVIGLSLIGIPNALALGILAGALSIVPFLGIIVSIVPAMLFAFLSAHDSTEQWLRPLGVLIVFAAVQMIESMFVTPRVQSESTGLHPIAIILGILFWSLVLPGLLGPIVAVPLTCAAVVLLRRYVWHSDAPLGESAAPAYKAR